MNVMKILKRFVGVVVVCLTSFVGLVPAEAATTVNRYIYPWLSGYSEEQTTFVECSDYWGKSESDEYFSILLNARESIEAPFKDFEIVVDFWQTCSKEEYKYSRTADLVLPNGDFLRLIKDPIRSKSTQFTDDPYWDYPGSCRAFLKSCWIHKDVYGANFTHTAPAGSYSLRLSTTFMGDVCRYEGATRICETNSKIEKSLTIQNLITITQTGIRADWEPNPNPDPTPEPEPKPTDSEPAVLYQGTLAKFAPASVTLSQLQKSQINSALSSDPSATKFICTGIVQKSLTKAEVSKILKRARAACTFAKALDPTLSTYAQVKQSTSIAMSGRVLITTKG